MIITETGILVSTDPNMRDPVPLNFKIEGGQVGDNTVRATGLTGNTTYYAQSYFVKDGIYIRQKGLTEFRTASQAEVLKIKNAYAGSNTIGINKVGNLDQITLDYSTDSGETWNTWNSANGNFSVTLDEDEEVWLKGNNNRISTGDSNYYKFTSTGTFDCEGNLSSLLRKDLSVLLDYCFYNLFSGSAIRIAPDLPAIDLSRSCYGRMFYQCTSLTIAPMLPYTVLSNNCYEYMFSGCSSLTQAPALPATTLAQSCYYNMFSVCSSLTQAPALPATTLAQSCYYNMFSGCSSLTQAPALPATTLAGSCYYQMFQYCSSLTQAPSLPATTLASGCYRRMFYNCTALTQAPALPATTLAGSCYYQMFQNCTSLTQAPALPATTLADSCYYGMFDHCSALTQAPSTLPATTLNYYCYYQMFYYCSSLQTAPVLYATSLTTSCYYRMFDGCSVLNKIICYATSWRTNDAFGWVTGVAQTGDFYNLGGVNIPIDSEHGVPIGWTLHTSLNDPLTFRNTSSGNNTITLTKNNSPRTDITLDYSTDGGSTWNSWSSANGNFSVTLTTNGTLKFKGNNTTFSDGYGYFVFGSTADCSVSGDINTLINENGGDISYTGKYRVFYSLFKDMTHLENAGIVLPSTTLYTGCYSEMFSGCTRMTTVPALPATNLGTTMSGVCYCAMFKGCTSITSVPSNLLPSQTVSSYCYEEMFEGCTSLTNLPNLPATDLTYHSLSMGAIECYRMMFAHCTSITSIPSGYLPATTLSESCYYDMFAGCTALSSIPANLLPATILEPWCYAGMFGAYIITPGSPGVSAYCTSLSSVPENLLPATTLAENCYNGMFSDAAITQSPVLPAATLADYSYMSMFNRCRSLRKITCYASDISATGCLSGWTYNVSSTGSFYNLGGATYPRGTSGIPTGWTEHTSL